jgi:outer membrane protein assembly factor BamB
MVALTAAALRRALLCAALVAGVAAVPTARAQTAPAPPATCGPADVPGGEWRMYGHDYSNSRYQDREKIISVGDVPLLTPAWTFSVNDAGGDGDITGTPAIADGCLYTATSAGFVYSLNADTGQLVWKSKVPQGGGITSSVAVGTRPCDPPPSASATKRKKKPSKRKSKSKPTGKSAAKKKKKKKSKRKVALRKARCPTVFVSVARATRGTNCIPGSPCIGPYAVAFDQATGRVVWASKPLDSQPGADMYASPVVVDDVLVLGISGGAAETGADEDAKRAFQGSITFLDSETGELLKKTYTVHPPKQPDDEYAGATVWSTPAIDPETKYGYVGAGNPFRPEAEHEHADAVLKFDVDRSRATFGQIVGSYKGVVDEYFPFIADLPCVDFPGNPPPWYPTGLGACLDIDLDFGAAPNIFKDGSGRTLVGAGQKSGVYHVFDAQTMKPAWTQIVGPPSSVGGIVGSTAYDGQSIYGPVTVPGYTWSISAADGAMRWISPILDGLHWGPPVAVANGVVYTVDFSGTFDAYDARNGALLLKRPLVLGGSQIPSLSWGGVSIARNTIYASVGTTGQQGFVVAYRPGGVNDVVSDVQETIGGLGGGGGGGGGAGGLSIVAGPGASSSTFATPVMVTPVGGPLNFLNLDAVQHDVTSDAKAPDGGPLFHSKLIGLGETAPIDGLDRVVSGQTYGFYCSIHPGMTGQLIVQ